MTIAVDWALKNNHLKFKIIKTTITIIITTIMKHFQQRHFPKKRLVSNSKRFIYIYVCKQDEVTTHYIYIIKL